MKHANKSTGMFSINVAYSNLNEFNDIDVRFYTTIYKLFIDLSLGNVIMVGDLKVKWDFEIISNL